MELQLSMAIEKRWIGEDRNSVNLIILKKLSDVHLPSLHRMAQG